jgi:uncharacterized protein
MSISLLRLRLCRAVFLFTAIGLTPNNFGAETSRTAKHFLWRVSNAPASFYLIGSMHALRAVDYPLGPEIDQAISESKRFLYEHDIKHPDPDISSREMRDVAHFPTGVTLQQKVKPETFARIQKLLKTLRTSEFNDVKPWAIAYFMLEGPGMSSFDSRLSIERYVYQKAGGRAEIGGLETFNEFIHSISEMTDADNESFLLQTISYSERMPGMYVETIDAWKSGNTERTYQLYAPRTDGATGYWRWIQRRSANSIPRIEQAIKSGKPTMVIVGALHFCGPNSIVALLQKRGYRIEQL